MRQKDATETDGEGLQNSDQARNELWDRNVATTRATRKTD